MAASNYNFIDETLEQYSNDYPELVEEIRVKLSKKLKERLTKMDILVEVLAHQHSLSEKYYYDIVLFIAKLDYPEWFKKSLLFYIVGLKQGIVLNLEVIERIWKYASDLLTKYSHQQEEFIKLVQEFIDGLLSAKFEIKDGKWLVANKSTHANSVNSMITDEIRSNIYELSTKDNLKELLNTQDVYIFCTKDCEGNYRRAEALFTIDKVHKKILFCGFEKDLTIANGITDVMIKKISSLDPSLKIDTLLTIKELERITIKGQKEDLSIEELKYIYEIDHEIGQTRDIRIRLEKLLKMRNYKADLSRIFDCQESQVTNRVSDVLSGNKDLRCFFGELNLNVKNLHNVTCPEFLVGNLSVGKSKKIENVILPAFITKNNNLCFEATCQIENLVLPVRANEVSFPKLLSAKGIIFPRFAKRVTFKCLSDFDDCTFPTDVDYTVEMPSSLIMKMQAKSYSLK